MPRAPRSRLADQLPATVVVPQYWPQWSSQCPLGTSLLFVSITPMPTGRPLRPCVSNGSTVQAHAGQQGGIAPTSLCRGSGGYHFGMPVDNSRLDCFKHVCYIQYTMKDSSYQSNTETVIKSAKWLYPKHFAQTDKYRGFPTIEN